VHKEHYKELKGIGENRKREEKDPQSEEGGGKSEEED
jgi:hypothetical protein